MPSGGHVHGQGGADSEHQRDDGQGWLGGAVLAASSSVIDAETIITSATHGIR